MRAVRLKTLLLGIGLSFPACSFAAHVQIPIPLQEAFIESLVREQAFSTAGARLRVNDDGSGCQYLELRDPKVSTAPGRVVLRTVAQARAGRSVGGRCRL
ncbi:MAG: hypothetical protein P8Y69_05655, partial [Gammaproteobacteria bacterium]